MRPHASHGTAVLFLTLLALILAPTRPQADVAPQAPDKLVVLSTSDVKGKTGPCGCHIPKGGLARIASYADSIRAQFGQVLLVTTGGFFPEPADQEDVAWFMLDAMKVLGTDAAGVSEKELRYGVSFLRRQYERSRAPLTCANLLDRASRKPLVAPYLLEKVGTVTVGLFGLTSDKVDLGSAADTVIVEDPVAAARRTVNELRGKGATVVVLLSSLGKIESEDVVTAVDGIDVLVCGRNIPLLQKGRMIKNTVVCYGGEQGQYIGRTIVTLDRTRRMSAGENETFVLTPDVGEKPDVLALVKSFEDRFNDKQRRLEKERAVRTEIDRGSGGADGQPLADHFLGAQFCQRCHAAQYEQWKGTKHARAWQALVDVKQDAKPECLSCHVTGFQQPGGFQSAADAPRLADVQCESCHGMGTRHEAWPAESHRVAAATCQSCHTSKTSPTFDFAIHQPHVLHRVPATLPMLPASRGREHALGAGAR